MATNAGQPWNVVAGLANDAGTFVLDRFRGCRGSQDSAGVAVSAESRCEHAKGPHMAYIEKRVMLPATIFMGQCLVVHASASLWQVLQSIAVFRSQVWPWKLDSISALCLLRKI